LLKDQQESLSQIDSHIETIDKITKELDICKYKLDNSEDLDDMRMLIDKLMQENAFLKSKIVKLEEDLNENTKKTNKISQNLESDRNGSNSDNIGKLNKEVDIIIEQQKKIEIEVINLREKAKELTIEINNLNEELSSVNTVPIEFFSEFDKFQKEADVIWNRINEAIIEEEIN